MSEHDNPLNVPNALPLGYRFNEFEIKEVIGGGGFGIVYRAWDHQLERDIAIKEFMPASLAVRSDDLNLVLRSERFSKTFYAGLNSFIQEARLLARFNHPNLLHVLRFWVQNDTAYMGTVLYSGTTLSTLRERNPQWVDEAWIRRLLPPLLGAIKTIHEAGYLHRDISLDNIQIQNNGEPVLLDFGSARKTIGNLSDESETMLRPGYAPIEQYSDNDESEQGAWTDIYALGAVLHALITGAPPPVSVVRSIEDNYLPLAQRGVSGYSVALLTAVDCALALKPEDRTQSIDAFAKLIALPEREPELFDTEISEPGTMLVLVDNVADAEPISRVTSLLHHRFALPGLVAVGVLVGLGVGMLMSGGAEQVAPPETVQNSAPVAPPEPQAPAEQPAAPVQAQITQREPEPVWVAQVYIKLQQGERVEVNGKPQALVPAMNGFAALQLAPGNYTFAVSGQGGTREQTLQISQEGVWLLDPHS
ncbi:serine/threonine protein kinase [Pectobacterium parmentieri]|uniref:non-specific serine/threonine protein kinase n=1 Tax=Pectobacterium parmentieri TaxID=1905730 RepID=A0A0H3I5I5_PECPM|nr:serine/threonine-protein kinase [Pectobacterium parmentieri]ACX88209.1 serine/threonine protein kinase [Pectobacterium parmentieri WPP163]AFI90509.1 Transmembrane serine/threonine-protein kinase L pknL [Pectobacterium parmentieri]MBI0470047.1 serine/threonine protein kinase [Pectobacterium parmentieri]MBI0492647.1 serine/threonine protein kinase [Pectobacterium parmentieri]MBI0553092.1 serine/threonine protein kinase [Pectobacterium parmentieri]